MKKFYLMALMFSASLSLPAQSSLDLLSRSQVRKQLLMQKQQEKGTFDKKMVKLKSVMGVPASHSLAIIKMAPGSTEDDLRAEGINVLRSRCGFAFVSVPVSDVERVSRLRSVRRMQLARPVKQKMKYAREATGVDKIHQGFGLPQAYTGKGVVCGIVDGGIDPNHINFRNADGTSRVGWLAWLTQNPYATNIDNAVTIRDYQRDEMKNFTTDDNTSYHGTHTLGIMAGGYRGTSTVSTPNSNEDEKGLATLAQEANPYYGVAYDADIAAACGDLMDLIIAMGVDYISQYAEYENKPCVINISLGSNTGAHDGRGVINQFFDLMAEEYNTKICISAGNEGDQKIALNKTMTAEDNEMKSFVTGYDYEFTAGTKTYTRAGSIEFYGDDDAVPDSIDMGNNEKILDIESVKAKKAFEIQAVLFNKSRGRISKIYPLGEITLNNQAMGKYWASSSSYQEADTDIIDQTLGKYFNGYVGIGWDIDPDNNRFYALIEYMVMNNNETNADHNYELGFVVKGKEGQRIYAYCDGAFSQLGNEGVADWDDGMYDGSINDMATGKSTLCVGSFNTHEEYGCLDGYSYLSSADIPTGEITSFTSYGTLIDGRTLPHVCAPGANIVSSASYYYVNAGYVGNEGLVAKTDDDGRTNYWAPMMGTSMASPHVAGAIALWLEADPTLTMDEIKDIIAKTAVKDEAVQKANPIQAGAGKFDAYEGLKEVLRRGASGIGGVTADRNRLVVTATGDRSFNVFLGGAKELRTAVYDITGKFVKLNTTKGDEASIDLSSLAKGVYVINVNGCHSQRVVVK